jgi:hypothetical protein
MYGTEIRGLNDTTSSFLPYPVHHGFESFSD